MINGKKVYRLMKEARLLNSRIRRDGRGKQIVKGLLPNPRQLFECMQTDIKYIQYHYQHRNALLIMVLDVFSRGALGYRLEWSITKHQVIDLMRDVLYHYRMPEKVSLRTDNGSQFEAVLFREYLKEMSIDHEFTYVASLQETATLSPTTLS